MQLCMRTQETAVKIFEENKNILILIEVGVISYSISKKNLSKMDIYMADAFRVSRFPFEN